MIVDELRITDRLVVIMPDRQNTMVWQTPWFFTQKKYFYHLHTSLLGVSTWSHWALLVDWAKMVKSDDIMTPGREYDAVNWRVRFSGLPAHGASIAGSN